MSAALIFSAYAQAPAPKEAYPFAGEVTSDNINIRSDSTASSAVIVSVNKGTPLEVSSGLYEWYKVRLPKKTAVYIKKNLVNCIKNDEQVSSSGQKQGCVRVEVSKDRVNIRFKPLESSFILGKANKGEQLNVIRANGEWYEIEPSDNCFGWIYSRFVTKSALIEKNRLVAADTAEAGKVPVAQQKTIEGQDITVEGIVKPYGKIFGRIATHKIVTSDSQIYLLKADKTLLNSYNYQKAKVSGKVITSKKEKIPLIEVSVLEKSN